MGGVFTALRTPRRKRSSAPGSSIIASFLGLDMADGFRSLKTLETAPDIAAALGDMVVAWANAESALLWALSHAAQIDANLTLTMYYRIPTFEARTKVIRAILQDDDCKLKNREAIDEVVERLSKLSRARNNWIHGAYFSDGKNIVTFDYRVRHDHPSRRKPIKANDIRHHVATVLQRTKELQKMLPHDPFFA